MPRFEYLAMILEESTAVEETAPHTRTWRTTLSIWRPGADAADTVDVTDEPMPWLSKLNELGDDGWDLVSEQLSRVAVTNTFSGWHDVSFPVRTRWTLKRATS